MKTKNVSRSKRPTLREVSELAGVSVMTVSNVVNKRFEYVSDKTRARVEKIIKEIRYHPNPTSRRLRSSQEFSVSMVIVDDTPAFLQDPFITELVAGISNHLSVNNYTLSLQGVTPDQFQNAAIFATVGMDALCVVNCGSSKVRQKNVDFVKALGQPVVLLQETLDIEDEDEDIAIINQDDYSGGHMIASHVFSKGARRLLMLVPSMEWPAITERKRGMDAAIADLGKGASLEVLVCADEGYLQTQQALRRYIAEHGAPDAVLGGNDRLGIAALRYLQDTGMSVPEDILVTGFNGFESHRYTHPILTTIISPASEMGQYAAASIIRRLQTGKFTNHHTLYPVRFQQGGSA